jgi:hypothetical protein
VIDLPEMVGAAVVRMLSDHFQRERIQVRRMQTANLASPAQVISDVELPVHLTKSVTAGRAVLWVGSGISLRAGLPSAVVLTEALVRSIQDKSGGYRPPSVGSGIASVASDFELLQSRDLLLKKLRELLDLPGGVTPTEAHFRAVQLFPRIITTNYDQLLETAAEGKETGHVVVVGPKLPTPAPEKFIWKIHGALDHPDVLVLSESDLAAFEAGCAELLTALAKLFESGPVLVAGTSLRDPSVLRLFRALRSVLDAYWTVIPGDVLGQARARDLRLQVVEGTLENVLATLERTKDGPSRAEV